MEEVADVKFGIVVRSLGVADIFAVDPDECGGVDASEVEHCASSAPVGRYVERAFVGAYWVDAVVDTSVIEAFTGVDEWRGVGVGILDVGVDRLVVALHFPVGGYGYGVPGRCVEALVVEVKRTFRGVVDEVELPCSVEAQIAVVDRFCPWGGVVGFVGEHCRFRCVGHHCGCPLLFVLFENRFVFPEVFAAFLVAFGSLLLGIDRQEGEFGCFAARALHQGEVAVAVGGNGHVGLVGRYECGSVDGPKLRFVRAVVDSEGQYGALCAYGQIACRIDHAPAAREPGDAPELLRGVGAVLFEGDCRGAGLFDYILGVGLQHDFIVLVLVEAHFLLCSRRKPCRYDEAEGRQHGAEKWFRHKIDLL